MTALVLHGYDSTAVDGVAATPRRQGGQVMGHQGRTSLVLTYSAYIGNVDVPRQECVQTTVLRGAKDAPPHKVLEGSPGPRPESPIYLQGRVGASGVQPLLQLAYLVASGATAEATGRRAWCATCAGCGAKQVGARAGRRRTLATTCRAESALVNRRVWIDGQVVTCTEVAPRALRGEQCSPRVGAWSG